MKLLSVTLSSPEGLGDLSVSFANENGKPLDVALVFGGPGAGKTTLLSAVAHTRPGHTVAMGLRPADPACFAHCTWWLGLDDPDRAEPLLLMSPNAPAEFAPQSVQMRRDSAFFERLARDGGFVFLCFSALRWFSKNALLLTATERTVRRYDVRSNEPLDDAGRHDLTREVKQALAYAAIVRVLPDNGTERHRLLGESMAELVHALASVLGFGYTGLDPASLEPTFSSQSGQRLTFDRLPTPAKHAVAFGALTLRALWAAYPGMNPQAAPGVVAIDQLELHQDSTAAPRILDVLAAALPEVQWIVTTRSADLLAARPAEERFALHTSEALLPPEDRHGAETQRHVSVRTGRDAAVH